MINISPYQGTYILIYVDIYIYICHPVFRVLGDNWVKILLLLIQSCGIQEYLSMISDIIVNS